MAKRTPGKRVRLRPADPFDLIRLLARSQHDPRKAVAELVQNSLDAGAGRIDVTWFTEKGSRALRILDDGRGVFPEAGREEALRRIATTIGHSHKRSLTPAERQRLMAVGKYGIGLLGFWSVGRVLEIRSRVGAGETWCLRLREDSAEAQLARVRSRRLHEEGTYTEVTILGVHEGAARSVRPARLHAYLADELRGQLLQRAPDLRIHDRVARGRSMKEFAVRPRRFRGRPLREFATLAVPGREPARLELYLLGEEDPPGRVALACGGTTVLDDIAEADGTGDARAPWDTGRFEGTVDFPALEVAPGTRRGFLHDGAAEEFLRALEGLEGTLRGILDEEERRREEEKDRDLARQLRRAFRPLSRRLPEYDLFDIRGGSRAPGPGGNGAPTEVAGESPGASPEGAPLEEEEPGDAPSPEAAPAALYPPGPLAEVRLVPSRVRIPVDTRRRFRARPLDGDRRPAAGAVAFSWSLEGPGSLDADGDRAVYQAPTVPGEALVRVAALQGATRAAAGAAVEVVEDAGEGERAAGIPEPTPVHDPGGPWRSRLRSGTWEYNTAHRDYAEVAADAARRFRYLVHLFAKEVVVRNFGRPGDDAHLERMVEVLTYLKDTRPGGRRAPS